MRVFKAFLSSLHTWWYQDTAPGRVPGLLKKRDAVREECYNAWFVTEKWECLYKVKSWLRGKPSARRTFFRACKIVSVCANEENYAASKVQGPPANKMHDRYDEFSSLLERRERERHVSRSTQKPKKGRAKEKRRLFFVFHRVTAPAHDRRRSYLRPYLDVPAPPRNRQSPFNRIVTLTDINGALYASRSLAFVILMTAYCWGIFIWKAWKAE